MNTEPDGVFLQKIFPDARPTIGLVLGSGWGAITDIFDRQAELGYDEIPGLGPATVSGHAGRLILGQAAGLQTLIFQGRRHWYENADWTGVLAPVRICRRLGVRTMVLTNAAGGIRADLATGAIMILDDHINAMGVNPLMARWDGERTPFFPDQSEIYDRRLRDMARDAAGQNGIPVAHGVYAAVSGPSYETPAEIRMYRAMGADAIGMSTVPEAMLANALGLRVLGLSCITNPAAGMHAAALNHAEVTATAGQALPALRQMLQTLWTMLAEEKHD